MDRVWVLAEQRDGVAHPGALELVSAAASIATTVEVWSWGPGAAGVAATLGSHGATRLFDLGDLGDVLPAPAVAAALAERADPAPDAILFPSSYDGRDVAARLSVRLDRPLLANVVFLDDDAGTLVVEHAVSAGGEVVRSSLTGDAPGLYLVRPKSYVAADAGHSAAEVEAVRPPDVGQAGGSVVLERHVEARQGPSLDDASIVVSGGRGLGDAENFALVERLAALLDAGIGASRAVVDAGWAPYAMQIGQTGKTVKPDVYLALGISGASQHLVGMKDAHHIVAIDRDERAPMLALAELGVVGDLHEVVPRLIAALEARG